jgi:UDP-GlcNAc:undecaprenyl-phosphate GlcNAc-1-phosphate transferase
MGDGGSQFLGLTLGFLAVYLTQVANTTLSPALPALILGLPIIDIIAVFIQRVYSGMNWFRATRNHIHHRLLALGFKHYESVIFIYSLQALLVVSGVLLPYEQDGVLIGIYLAISAAVFAFLITAENTGWRFDGTRDNSPMAGFAAGLDASGNMMSVVRTLIKLSLSAFLVSGAILAADIPADVSLAAAVLFLLLLTRLLLGYRVWFLYLRLTIYVALAFVAYLVEFYPPDILSYRDNVTIIFFGMLAILVMLSVKYSKDEFFEASPLDYLVVLIVIVLSLMAETRYVGYTAIRMAVELIVMFYGAEIVLKHMARRWNGFTGAVLVSLAIIGVRGIV